MLEGQGIHFEKRGLEEVNAIDVAANLERVVNVAVFLVEGEGWWIRMDLWSQGERAGATD